MPGSQFSFLALRTSLAVSDGRFFATATASISKGCRNVGVMSPSFHEQFDTTHEQFDTTKSSKRRFSCAGCLTNNRMKPLREFDNSDSGFHKGLGRGLVSLDVPPNRGLIIPPLPRLPFEEGQVDPLFEPVIV
jgi:hypothetical protein